MAKKGSTRKQSGKAAKVVEQPNKQPEAAEPEVTARPIDYLRATLGLIWKWVKTHKRRTLLIMLILVIVGGTLGVLLRPSKEPLTNDEIITLVNKTLDISGDGHPAILTVEDKSRTTQPFLDQAENGDKVLLYYKAKRAVLFRPRQNVIIHQGSYVPPAARVFIRKGTTNDAAVTQAKSKLTSVKEVTLASEDESTNKNYKGITLVSVTDRYDEKLRELETLFGVKTVRLPAGETFPDADILVIVGN